MKNIKWLNEDSRKFLAKDYLIDGETAEQRMEDIAMALEKRLGIKGYGAKFLDYLEKGYFFPSTPFWANFGRSRGLPISCFGSYIDDSLESIFAKLSEVAMMTKGGGGTSAYFGALRARGAPIRDNGHSTGAVHFMSLFDNCMDVVSQGSVRRGAFAAYLPVEHPDIEEFLKIRGVGNPIQNLSIGVCITDEWMAKLDSGDKEARKIWGLIIKKRFETGYPYIFFTDTVNNAAPQVYKDKGLFISHSNLCTEICLSNSVDESFVCDLMSMNCATYDEWKDTDAVQIAIFALDAVMSEFIEKTEGMASMEACRKFAINQRALGLGLMGYHTYLQSKMIAFESMEAKFVNGEIWSLIRSNAEAATKELAIIFGEPPLLEGYGVRNALLLAPAPNTSSSFIGGQVSPSVELENSCYYIKELAKGKFTYKNSHLESLLKSKGQNTKEVWKSILIHGGSVQHLDCLDEHEKNVFKTSSEVSQKEVVIQAAQRQKYIDQSQSLNLMIPSTTKAKEVSDLLIFGHKNGIKTFYYQRSSNPSQALSRSISTCVSCEG